MSLVQKVSNLRSNHNNVELTKSYGLDINTICWEDAARTKGSCWGPNISDLTLMVGDTPMNMIRKPNFADVTCDLPADTFKVTVGNEDGSELRRIPLREYVENISKDLWLQRDSTILASAQCCVLPCDETGETEFCPQLYNYQSAVLVITSSSQGTSHQFMSRREFLYFNKNGQKAKFLAKRLKQDRKERSVAIEGEMTSEEQDRNVILIYQIPLKRVKLFRGGGSGYTTNISNSYEEESDGESGFEGMFSSTSCATSCNISNNISSNIIKHGRGGNSTRFLRLAKLGMDNAMLRVSDNTLGEFPKITQNLARDDRFPIRVTYQFYKVTDSEDLAENDIEYMADKINNIYKLALSKGSLVLSESDRITESKPINLTLPPNLSPLFGL